MTKTTLVLGTVQLGMKYGLNNTAGQPTKEESFSILDTALAAGIETFDTAWAYGIAEDVLGEWIQARSLAGKIKLISKMKPHALEDYAGGTPPADVVRSEIEKSLKRLHVENLDGYLLHTPEYIYNKEVVAGLQKIKADGLANHIGVSTYDEAEALHAASLGVDYVQVPYNALDQRLDRTDFFEHAKKNKVTVFARSPFLQGLLLMEPSHIPPHLVHARPLVEKFVEIVKRHHLTRLEASLLFSYHARAPHVVFGVETLAQLNEVLAIDTRISSMSIDCVTEIREAFQTSDRAIVNPSLWSRT